jgi:branched-chain amino acid transport system ATP-binding protein
VQVLEGRRCFAHLTVEENILAGGFAHRPSRRALAADVERVYTWFPRLKQRRKTPAGLSSGGEQQMIAIGRALMTHPHLVLLDEPSMGLAPMLVEEIFEIVCNLNRRDGVSFLIAEQNVGFALRYADHAYVLENGQVRAKGRAEDLARRADLAALYLGSDVAAA